MARSSTSFGPGNRAALKTGLRSVQLREERRAVTGPKIRGLLLAFAAEGELDPAEGNEHPLLTLAANSLLEVLEFRKQLKKSGMFSGSGELVAWYERYQSQQRLAMSYLDKLGIGPRARHELLRLAIGGDTRTTPALASLQELRQLYAPSEAS
jgi:hypothetical protein